MSAPPERLELFLSYLRNRTSLTSEQIQGIENLLAGFRFRRSARLPKTGPEDADRIEIANIFKNGKIKASVNPSTRLLPVQDIECFLTEIIIAIHSQDLLTNAPGFWLDKHRTEITYDLQEDFGQIVMQWAVLEHKLKYFGLMKKDNKAINKKLSELEKNILSKIPDHQFPKGTLSKWVEKSSRVDLIDRLIDIFKTYVPELKDDPKAHRISELLGAFGKDEKAGTIRQRMSRTKAQTE